MSFFTEVIGEFLKELGGAVTGATFDAIGRRLSRRTRAHVCSYTMTCRQCGRVKSASESQAAAWKENPGKPRRCQKCRGMTTHTLST